MDTHCPPGKQGMVSAHADSLPLPRVEACAALTDDDLAGEDELAAKHLDTQVLRWRAEWALLNCNRTGMKCPTQVMLPCKVVPHGPASPKGSRLTLGMVAVFWLALPPAFFVACLIDPIGELMPIEELAMALQGGEHPILSLGMSTPLKR